MTGAPAVQVVLLGRQPFRCDWEAIDVPDGHERHLVVSRALLDQVDARQLAENFAVVHPVDGVDIPSTGAVIDALLARGCALAAVATNDEYLLTVCAELQERHNLSAPKSSDVAIFTDKLAMKQAVLKAGLQAPAGMALDPDDAAADPLALARRIEGTCGLPVVLKPRSSANSLDVAVLNTVDELVERCRALSRDDLMAETFIPGRVLFCDSLSDSTTGLRTTLMTAVYASPPLEYRSGSSHGSRTLSDGPLATEVQAFAEQVLKALPPMDDRVTHLEVLESDGALWFLEVAARAPGAEVARCGELHLGVNLEELNFRLQLGLPWQVFSPPRGHVAWMWFPKQDGIVMACVPPPLNSPTRLTWQVTVGDSVTGAAHSPNNRREDAALIVVIGPSDAASVEADFISLEAFEPVTYGDPGGQAVGATSVTQP